MDNQWWAVIVFLLVAINVNFVFPRIFAEVFPWQKLYAHRTGRPTLLTKSYAGRTVLITGANGAYGSRAAKLFASRDASTLVLVDVRDTVGVKGEIEQECERAGKPKPTILTWQVDMMTFAGCQELAAKAKQELENLDHVLMTMGILSTKRKESPEGWETSIQVNYLSNACAGLLLLPLLKASPSNRNPPVMTFITSFAVYPASPTMGIPKSGGPYLEHLSNNKDGMAQQHQYGRSKALLLYFTRELAARTAKAQTLPQKVTINSADPGTAWTPLTQPNRGNPITRWITDFGARDAMVGATALVNGVSAPAAGNGKIMIDFGSDGYPPFMERSKGLAAQARVWEETRSELEAKVPEIKQIYEMLQS